ncbi:mechanosensitive ion channel family protein [Gudongella sp. DL1XJH-153]|uniref:mechanosensitive ion channel family protein n=1 Tax=Gudongella sp. DL1XJH-153 TaxID=3409804 RepID=UPI003BB57A1D
MLDSIYIILRDHLLIPAIVILALFFTRPLINKYLRKNETYSQLGNWIILYAFLIFFLSYYQNSTWLFYPFISFGSVGINLNLLIVSFLIITMAFHISKVFTKQFLPGVYSRYQLDRGIQFTFNRLFHYVIMIIAIFMTASVVGIQLSALTVFAGVLGVGVGFGLQNITSNFISGIILLFERPIKIGDRVIVEDIIGDVEQINMRATIIRSVNNEHIIVPNSYFLEEHVINRSFGSPFMRLVAPVGVSYDSDPDKVKELLLQVAYDEAKENPAVLLEPKPYIHFVGFGDSSLDFEIFVWVSDPRDLIKVKTNINFKIFRIFKENNIEIPYPQQDLHLRSVDKDLLKKQFSKSEN